MAGKEATLILLDVGSSMYQQFSGTKEKTSRLEISLDCVRLMLQQKLFNYKNHEVGLILFGTEEAEDGKTIYIQEIQKVDLNFIRNVGELGNHESPQTEGGDIFDALDKAVAAIDEFVGTKKFEKKIYVMTCGNGESEYKEKQISRLVKMIKKVGVKVNFIAIDFMDDYNQEQDDPDRHEQHQQLQDLMLTGSDKQTPIQNQNQKLLFLMAQELRENMRIFPAQVAFELYSQFQTKQVAARASFRGDLQINNSVGIQVLIFKKTTEEKLPSLKKYSTIAQFDSNINTNEVKNDSVFYIQDDPNMTPVEKENIIMGYQYGKQIVPIDKIMEEKMKYPCPRAFQLLGFVDKANVPRHFLMSSIDMVVPVESERSRKQISSLITALIATRKVGLARFVGRDKGAPKLVILIPHKSRNYECFWMAQLPTAEDIRAFQFASLRRSTVGQQQAVSQLIDAMDLTNVFSESGEPEELLKMKYVVNPTRQYFQQAVIHKAINQTDTIPPISPVIMEYLRPEIKVNLYAQEAFQKVKNTFKFKKNELKKVGEKKVFWKQLLESEVDKMHQIDDDDVVEVNVAEEQMVQMLAKQKFGFEGGDDIVKEIGSVNPLEDFKKMVGEKRMDLVEPALDQIQKVILRMIDESLKGSYYNKALECLKEMRKACISEDETDVFNKFLFHIKNKYKLSSTQDMIWPQIIKEGITLISMMENKTSAITAQEALEFLNQEDKMAQAQVDRLQNEEEQLLAEIE